MVAGERVAGERVAGERVAGERVAVGWVAVGWDLRFPSRHRLGPARSPGNWQPVGVTSRSVPRRGRRALGLGRSPVAQIG
ncbi:MAG: hypothetical protein EA001_13530 [Oscillatoriales cyanobacterium]|nr:MAG: hypothetical protein EA001_13530 [Oscillatoriales cyanobacterium]